MTKKSKHPRYDDPSAFGKRFPRIEKRTDGGTPMRFMTNEQQYKMGAIHVTVTAPDGGEHGLPGYFMSIHGRDRYPDWDEIVWLRYHLIPDAVRMALILPNLNSYINQEDTAYKYVFTLEQTGWALDPRPECPSCLTYLDFVSASGVTGLFECKSCEASVNIDLSTWNEQHGNGYLAKEGDAP